MTAAEPPPTPFLLKHPSVSKATAHVPFAPLNKAGGKNVRKHSEDYSIVSALRGGGWQGRLDSVIPKTTLL